MLKKPLSLQPKWAQMAIGERLSYEEDLIVARSNLNADPRVAVSLETAIHSMWTHYQGLARSKRLTEPQAANVFQAHADALAEIAGALFQPDASNQQTVSKPLLV